MERKTERIEVRLTPHEVTLLDQRRGNLTRSAWLRQQIGVSLDDSFDEDTDHATPQTPAEPTTNGTHNGVGKPHRHRGTVIEERLVRGMKLVTLRCDCGTEWTRS